jgi:glycine oxidase
VRPSVVIVGGGVMGCACAWELARAGARVVVLERSVPGAEASSAAAGILGARVEAHDEGPLAALGHESRRLYPRFVRELARSTGIDVEYRESGVLKVVPSARALTELARSVAWQKPSPLRVNRAWLRRQEPALAAGLAGGVLFEDDARIDPRLLLRALHIAASNAGVTFRSGAYVRGVVRAGGRATGVSLDDGTVVPGTHVLVAAGSWTSLVGGVGLKEGSVEPVRGQIVELETETPAIHRVVFGPKVYLVPRDDGRVLVGSTMEFVGYRREVTAGAVRDLLDAALRLCPALESASLRASWSSFRPYTPDALPLIGESDCEGLLLATGHHRNGILLAPVTAAIIAALVLGKRPSVALGAFTPRRAGYGTDAALEDRMPSKQSRMAASTGPKGRLEGEGSYSATRSYNKNLGRALADKAGIARGAESARKAVEGPEGAMLREAEKRGKAGPKAEKRTATTRR